MALPRCPFASPAPALATADRREAWHAQGWGYFMRMLGSPSQKRQRWVFKGLSLSLSPTCPAHSNEVIARPAPGRTCPDPWILPLHCSRGAARLSLLRLIPQLPDVLRSPSAAEQSTHGCSGADTAPTEPRGPAFPTTPGTSTLPWPQPPLPERCALRPGLQPPPAAVKSCCNEHRDLKPSDQL